MSVSLEEQQIEEQQLYDIFKEWRDARQARENKEATDKEVKEAVIEDTFFGYEDHGILTFWLNVCFDKYTCTGIGGYALDYWDDKQKMRVPLAKGIEGMLRVMEIVGVQNWEDLKDKHIRIKDPGWGRPIDEIANLYEDNWLDLHKFFTGKAREA